MADEGLHLAPSDNAHIDRRFDEVMQELKKIGSAFTVNEDGTTDFEGHRKFHEEKIRAAKAEAEFWSELKLEIAKKGLWSLLVVICGLVVVGVSAKMGLTK
jgi:hypothetical protein